MLVSGYPFSAHSLSASSIVNTSIILVGSLRDDKAIKNKGHTHSNSSLRVMETLGHFFVVIL